MTPLDLGHVRSRLRAHRGIELQLGGPTAAVAAVLREGPEGAEVLLIERAVRAGDPWSGQMALPGGRRDPADPDLLGTALREAREEVDLDLAGAELLGALDDVHAVARGRASGLVVRPYVFHLGSPGPLRPNEEVAATLWAPLRPLLRGERDTVVDWRLGDALWQLPGWSVGDRTVWGLTHRMLSGMLELLR